MNSSWLNGLPWESVLALNREICAAQKIEPVTQPAALERARQRWEEARQRGVSLGEALDLCRECHALQALVFNNGNTFAAISRRLLEEPLQSLPPVEAQIVRTTVSHYTVGWIHGRELSAVLSHYEAAWRKPGRPAPAQDTPPLNLRPASGGTLAR